MSRDDDSPILEQTNEGGATIRIFPARKGGGADPVPPTDRQRALPEPELPAEAEVPAKDEGAAGGKKKRSMRKV
ncbi:MAG TPA: hypothetical protein VFJ18_11435, partial [Pararhizobium sp.]|nr:hypothetical protein [Pararhizobium sp.]